MQGQILNTAPSGAQSDWFSDGAVRGRYRYWLTGKGVRSFFNLPEADAERGARGFVPFEYDSKDGWLADVGLEQYLSDEEAQGLADVIWEVEDWDVRPWKMTPIYERFEGAAKVYDAAPAVA